MTVPVHAGNVAPKVARSVRRTDLDRVDKHRIALKKKETNDTKNDHSPKGDAEIVKPYLQEPANVRLVVGAHENHVLKQPEKGPAVSLLRPQHG